MSRQEIIDRDWVKSAEKIWNEFDLSSRREGWDEFVQTIRDSKSSSTVIRKQLNEISRSFRSTEGYEQISSAAETLLTSYQMEIDRTIQRARHAESAFLSIYKLLRDAPDPAIFFHQIQQSSSSSSGPHLVWDDEMKETQKRSGIGASKTLQKGFQALFGDEEESHSMELERLRQEVQEYEEEFRRLKNQEVTIRRLEDELAAITEEKSMKVHEELYKEMETLREEFSSQLAIEVERRQQAEKRIQVAEEASIASEQMASRAQSQVLQISSEAEQRIATYQLEAARLADALNFAENELMILRASHSDSAQTSSSGTSHESKQGAPRNPNQGKELLDHKSFSLQENCLLYCLCLEKLTLRIMSQKRLQCMKHK